MKPRRRIRSVSPRTALRNRVWKKVRDAFMAAHPFCARCGAPSTDPHHLRPRSVAPKLVCEPRNLCALCHGCHLWLNDHRAEAYAAGWLKLGTEPL